MLNEITKVSFDTIREAAAAGESITVIINGEHYDIDTTPAAVDPEAAFIEGVKFAAAAIQDHRARMNLCFNATARRNPKTTKRAIACNEARNKEAKNAADFLEYITKPGAGFDRWLEEYRNGNLWRLEK